MDPNFEISRFSAEEAEIKRYREALTGLSREELMKVTQTSTNTDETEAAFSLIDELDQTGQIKA